MHEYEKDTILLICSDETAAASIISDLFEADLRVVGPIQTARMALAMAAQTSPTLALLVNEPTGERKAPELAQALMATWGVRSMMLDATIHVTDSTPDWLAPPHQIDRVRRALARHQAEPCPA